tara:strand:- start:2060 stop:2398 length:339 start_codon:yes stop_codon:yes gene_type:complete
MRNDVTKRITNVLVTGKRILEIYESYDLPAQRSKYKEFVYDSLKVMLDKDDHHFEGYADWLFSNENNTLPKSSSGSTFTALGDPDNFLPGCGDDLDDDEMEFFETLFRSLFI